MAKKYGEITDLPSRPALTYEAGMMCAFTKHSMLYEGRIDQVFRMGCTVLVDGKYDGTVLVFKRSISATWRDEFFPLSDDNEDESTSDDTQRITKPGSYSAKLSRNSKYIPDESQIPLQSKWVKKNGPIDEVYTVSALASQHTGDRNYAPIVVFKDWRGRTYAMHVSKFHHNFQLHKGDTS